jgi:hypothetical protein
MIFNILNAVDLQIIIYVILAISLVVWLLIWLTRDEISPLARHQPPVVINSQSPLEDGKAKDNLTDVQIANFIKILREKLPSKPTTHNLPFIAKPPEGMDNWENGTLEKFCTKQVNEICDFIFLQPAIKILFVTSIDVPAKYVYYDGVHLLLINVRLLGSNNYCAFISREITGYYLKIHNVVIPDIESNNYLLDIATIYLGFGFQVLKAGQNQISKGTSFRYRLDPVTPIRLTINRDSIMRAIIATAKVRKQQPYIVISQFDPKNRKWAKHLLLELIQEYKSFKGAGPDPNDRNESPNSKDDIAAEEWL